MADRWPDSGLASLDVMGVQTDEMARQVAGHARELLQRLCLYPMGRHIDVPGSLEHARRLITDEMEGCGFALEVQEYAVDGHTRSNLIFTRGSHIHREHGQGLFTAHLHPAG
jgi:hypothetical protein